MRRVAIVGSSGAGKSWLASRLAETMGVSYVELDAIHHGPGWVALPADQMRRRVQDCCPADGAWVVDGNYAGKGGGLARARADTVIWIDLPKATVMRQLAVRTLRRLLLRQTLWNDNRESLRDLLALDPQRSVLRWSWTQYESQRARYAAELDVRWVRLASRAEVRRFLAHAAASRPGATVLRPDALQQMFEPEQRRLR